METAANIPNKGSIALMFPGQGSQFQGMSRKLSQESPTARQLLERADDILGYSLSKIMHSECGDELNRTVHTQPAIFVHSMALLAGLREHFALSPIIAAGHSLGEYSALCAAGVLDFDEALDIIRVRALGMEGAQPPGTCGMAALVGLTRDEVVTLLEAQRADHVLEAANFNSPEQVVVSGHLPAIKRVVDAAKKLKKSRAVMLSVSSAFHTPLMESARESLRRRLEHATLKEPKFPVVANVNGQTYPFPDGARELLADQLVRPVMWQDCVQAMRGAGADIFVEVGPGKVLTGLLKRIDRKARALNVSHLEEARSFQGVLA
ncbi:MAG: ACP S-malonyltransferase [Deltaproteobacteria bacterium]